MIIALKGFKQVGKSTAASYLEEKYGFFRVNFKDALVAEIKQNFPDLLREIEVDDCRFLNEAASVKKYGGTIVELQRPDITSGGTHKSETEQLEIVADHVIECVVGDHEKLYKELDKIVSV